MRLFRVQVQHLMACVCARRTRTEHIRANVHADPIVAMFGKHVATNSRTAADIEQ